MLYKHPVVKILGKTPMDYQITRGIAVGTLCVGLLLMGSRPFIISRLESEVQTIRTQSTQFQGTQSSKTYEQIANDLQKKVNNLNRSMIASTLPALGMSILGLGYLRNRRKSAIDYQQND